MIILHFIAGNTFNIEILNNIELFVNHFPDLQTVILNNENELELLLEVIGMKTCNGQDLIDSEFSKYWDISNQNLPEYTTEQFDLFYKKWLNLSGRENTIDEYGNLIFLQGLSSQWNWCKYRLILKEL